MKYRIHWKAIRTNTTGHGTTAFAKDAAQQIADSLNKDNAHMLVHWIEPIPEHESEEEQDQP